MKDELEIIPPRELQPGMVVTINNRYLCEYVKTEDRKCYFKDIDFNYVKYASLIDNFSLMNVDGIKMVRFSIGALEQNNIRIYNRPLESIDEINNKIDSLVKQVFSAIHALSRTK
jgi:hypothetical protein